MSRRKPRVLAVASGAGTGRRSCGSPGARGCRIAYITVRGRTARMCRARVLCRE